jgi:MATE family, multidrug efflux pump
LNKKILNLAVPNIVSNITIPLLGIVDLAIMGHLESEIYIGAIALGGMIFNFLYWGFGFLRMGTTGFTAQAFGSRNLARVSEIFIQSLFIGILGGLVIILLQFPIEWFSFKVINGSIDVETEASKYFYIRIWAAPATIGLYAFYGWFIGMQNTKAPMAIAILINVSNVLLNLYFVYVLKMKTDGVAFGTLISQYLGFFVALFIFTKYYKRFFKYISIHALKKFDDIKQFFKVNFDIFLRTMLLLLVFSFFTTQSANTSDKILAINTLLLQFLFIFSYFIDGFAHAAEALVGKYVGNKNKILFKESVKIIFIWGIGLSIPFSIVYFVFGKNLLFILTDQIEIIQASSPYLIWIGILPILSFAAFIWDGVFVGATASKSMRNSMLVSSLFIFIPVYYVSRVFLDNHGLWLAMNLFMLSRGLLLTFEYRKLKILS